MKRELTPYQKEALDYSSNILLTANAGSGKTFVLAKRFVEILLNKNTELENIVAITFTDKAAGELNKRIALEIDNRLEYEADEIKRKKLENSRRQLVSANISTIHSFCINILKEFAPEAGIDVSFTPIDQNTSNELIQLSIDEAINDLISDKEKSEELKYLVRFFGSKNLVVTHLTNAVYQRKTINQHLKEIYSNKEEEISRYFQNTFENLFEILFNKKIIEAVNCAEIINNHVLNQSKGNELAGEIAKFINEIRSIDFLFEKFKALRKIDLNLFTQKGEVKNRGYLSKDRDKFESEIKKIENIFSDLRPFIEIEEPDKSSLELSKFGKIFLSVFEYAAQIYSGKKNQKGFLDFEDILLYAQEVIKLDEVREYLKNKFSYIMIDEYQDTNELQYKIFMPVLDNLKHGNLFVVGDEKQSIYMFRDADLRVFNKTKEDIKSSVDGGKLLNLPHSFRMAPQLVLFTNKLFAKLFENHQPIYNEVEYNELVCAKAENESAKVEFLLADKEKEIKEAELVAGKIIELITNGDAELKDIGILCRKRNLFQELEEEFVKRNIPYSIVGGKGFYQRQTIYDVYNYLSFILNNNDDSALVGILRAPFYYVSDDILFEISIEDGDSFYNKLKNYSAKNIRIKEIITRIEKHIELGFSSEIYSLIRSILLDTSYWAVVASKRNSVQEIANLEKLLILARSFSQKSFKNLYDFTVMLRESIETMEDEGQAQVSQDDKTVKLLTIHQAKGLEFRAVFLYGCNGYAREDSIKARGLSIDKDFGFLAKVPIKNYFGEYSSVPIGTLYNFINHKKSVAEIKRLLYVAVTRAMNFLFISAAHKEFKAQRDSFFELFTNGLNLDFNEDEKLLGGKINFMKGSDENYFRYEKEINLSIKIQKEIGNILKYDSGNVKIEKQIYFNTKKINDEPEREIISATKISMFSQCPVKYELTYDLGYSTIFNLVKKQQSFFEFNSKEDEDSKLSADVKGRVIHNILKDDIKSENLEKVVEDYITSESSITDSNAIGIKSDIINDLRIYYSSNAYRELNEHKNYKNEIEIYCEEGKHYLFGIIDKLIIEKDKLIVVDYKTDDVEIDQIKYRADNYLPQLKFYAYILAKLYNDYSKFELRLIFIKHPQEIIQLEIHKTDLEKFGYEINSAIEKIIAGDYKQNLQHCSKCHFALEGNICVKSWKSQSTF